LLVAPLPPLAVAAAVAPAAPFAVEAGAFCVSVFWATRVAAADAKSVGAGDGATTVFTGAGTALAFDATCIAGAVAEVVGAAFCAETNPKAARPRLSNAATTMTTKRIVSLRHQRTDSCKVKAQSASESTTTTRPSVKDGSCGFRGTPIPTIAVLYEPN
jgi:hypothetical protein